jgi:NADH-quinone oxidoreductase subunit C
MTPTQVIQDLTQRLPDAVSDAHEFRGDWLLSVVPARIVDVCRFLRDAEGFDMLSDLSGVDHYGEDPRYEVHYVLYSFAHRFRLHLKVRVPGPQPAVDSVTPVWRTADWHEREAYDMFGIRFTGHPNLKRILMWEGYPYHPLRKDFPLAGLPADLPSTAVSAGTVETAPMHGGPWTAVNQTRSVRREPRQSDTLAEQHDSLRNPVRGEEV